MASDRPRSRRQADSSADARHREAQRNRLRGASPPVACGSTAGARSSTQFPTALPGAGRHDDLTLLAITNAADATFGTVSCARWLKAPVRHASSERDEVGRSVALRRGGTSGVDHACDRLVREFVAGSDGSSWGFHGPLVSQHCVGVDQCWQVDPWMARTLPAIHRRMRATLNSSVRPGNHGQTVSIVRCVRGRIAGRSRFFCLLRTRGPGVFRHHLISDMLGDPFEAGQIKYSATHRFRSR